RKVFLVAETLGLLYAISVGSIFGTVFNVSNLISILSKLRKP
ncbi:MAG: YgjV family protein, partial [Pseudomonadota bacterium]|nr:YgjV family protein [Pseudomonadota bacterium]